MESTLSDAHLARLLPKLQEYGRDWFREHNPSTPSAVLTKSGSFEEILGRAYFQGRRDKMSWLVLDTVRSVLHSLDWQIKELVIVYLTQGRAYSAACRCGSGSSE